VSGAYAAYAVPRDPTAVLGRRVLAYAIDIAIAWLSFFVLFAALAKRYDFAGPSTCDTIKQFTDATICTQNGESAFALTSRAALAVFLVPLGIAFLDMVVLQSLQGASIGKLLTGLRVVDQHGRIANFGPMVVRWLLLVVDGLCLVLGLVVASATSPHRRVGDMAAHTYVVGRRDAGRPVLRDAPAPAPAYTPLVQPTAAPPAPVWDPGRGAWVSFDPHTNVWLRYDGAAEQWTRLD
jgi:uncharacterized RDD family membrane protein YckC